MSKGLCPSKSTVYVSNLPFSLTNSDLHKLFEKYGKVVKVTILKEKATRRSRGVAFVLFLDRDSAYKAVRALHKTLVFERTICCCIANDNGRAPEFIRRREYKDKSRCYECGEEGHLSYNCSKNLFGDRVPPPKKKKTKKMHMVEEGEEGVDDEMGASWEEGDGAVDSLSAAIQYEQQMVSKDTAYYNSVDLAATSTEQMGRKRYRKNEYFSDEEELDDT